MYFGREQGREIVATESYSDKTRQWVCLLGALAAAVAAASCDLPEPGVVAGANKLTKELFYDKGLPPTVHLQWLREFGDDGHMRVAVFDQQKMDIVEYPSGRLVRRVEMTWPLAVYEPQLVPARGGKGYRILCSGVYSGCGLMNDQGEVLWRIATGTDMEAGDLDHDGETEFYVARKSGLHRLRPDGGSVWHVRGSYVRVALLPDSSVGSALAALMDDRGPGHTVRVFSPAGERICTFVLPIGELESCDWPAADNLLASSESSILVADGKGHVLLRRRVAAQIGGASRVVGEPYRFKASGPEHLAVLGFGGWSTNRSVFLILSADGSAWYEEIAEGTAGLCVVEEVEGTQVVLVGDGKGRIYAYRPSGEFGDGGSSRESP